MVCATALSTEMAKGQRFVFTIEPDLHEPIKEQAKKERRSVGSLLNFLMARYLEEQQKLSITPTIQHGGDRKPKDNPTDATQDTPTDAQN
jgi:hypothetical protein